MDSDIEIMFLTPPKHKVGRKSTIVRNLAKFNRRSKPNLESDIDTVWNKRLNENPKLYNGSKFRLESTDLDNANLILNIGITCYKDFIGTNWSPDAKKLHAEGIEIYNNKQAFMSDALGVGSFLLSSDNYVTFLKRSLHCGEAVGLWDIPGGHAEPKEITGKETDILIEDIDSDKITEEIYDSILREVVDEVNIPKDCLSDPLMLGIARNTTAAGRPSAEFLIRCTLTSKEIRDLYLKGSQAEADETTNIRLLPLSEVLQMTVDHELWKMMAPSCKGCISLAKHFEF